MDLRVRTVNLWMKDYWKVKEVYSRAFPRRERLPITVLILMSCRRKVEFKAFYAGSEFCGFAYLICYGRTTFIFYLAVDERLRSKNYGSQILKWIAGNTTETVALDIEAVSETRPAVNEEQRRKRKRFYLRNGYKDTGVIMREYGEIYDVLYYGDVFSKCELERLLQRFSFGFSRILFKIEERGNRD